MVTKHQPILHNPILLRHKTTTWWTMPIACKLSLVRNWSFQWAKSFNKVICTVCCPKMVQSPTLVTPGTINLVCLSMVNPFGPFPRPWIPLDCGIFKSMEIWLSEMKVAATFGGRKLPAISTVNWSFRLPKCGLKRVGGRPFGINHPTQSL